MNGKTQVVIKDSESNTITSNNNSTTITSTVTTTANTTSTSHITSKTVEFKNENGVVRLKYKKKQ
ncbi:hypothetical protein [Rickettsia helvetica]|uniref:Uncharacterized protein n=1 Tax=Rickettsia helvetica TaxID=35789 RepID=A0ABM9NBC8_RICHE|nr:hypothetical protein [Rickettsia helvetica]MCZ6883779.1 hypothetical protein [Rickettsia endosymbiont of Ixodes ricinus]MCZ6896901.1 hypothetical protein [Rickettsia endosymbiont of Ixodes ricinus]